MYANVISASVEFIHWVFIYLYLFVIAVAVRRSNCFRQSIYIYSHLN